MTQESVGEGEKGEGVNPVPDAQGPQKTESRSLDGSHSVHEADRSEHGGEKRSRHARGFPGRLTVNEWLTFLVGVGSLVVSYLTYKNATDTSDLKDAVAKLTDLAFEAGRQANAAQVQSQMMQGQLDQMTLAQRAWLMVDSMASQSIQQFPAGIGLAAFASYKITNIGHTPARSVRINTALILDHLDGFTTESVINLCSTETKEGDRLLGRYSDFILPGQSETIDGTGPKTWFAHALDTIRPEFEAQIKGANKELEQSGSSAISLPPSEKPLTLGISPVLAGCITYKTGGSDVTHRTGFAFKASAGPMTGIAITVGKKGEVLDGDLSFSPSFIGNFAD